MSPFCYKVENFLEQKKILENICVLWNYPCFLPRTNGLDRRLDALSLEVDQKLRSLRSQFTQQHAEPRDALPPPPPPSSAAAAAVDGARRSGKAKKGSSKDKKGQQQQQKVSATSTSSSSAARTSKISVTYENGRITNLSTNGDTLIEVRKTICLACFCLPFLFFFIRQQRPLASSRSRTTVAITDTATSAATEDSAATARLPRRRPRRPSATETGCTTAWTTGAVPRRRRTRRTGG